MSFSIEARSVDRTTVRRTTRVPLVTPARDLKLGRLLRRRRSRDYAETRWPRMLIEVHGRKRK
jgi:hypothetical protein